MKKYNHRKIKGPKRLVKKYPLVQNAMGYGLFARGDWIESRVIAVDNIRHAGGVCYYMQLRIPKRYKYWYTRDIYLFEQSAIRAADCLHFAFRYGDDCTPRGKDFV